MLKFSTLVAGVGFIAVGWCAGLIDVASERRKLLDVDRAFRALPTTVYSCGTFEISIRDASGRKDSRRVRYCTIWRKQTDGSWKIIVDIGNSGDTPISPPSRQNTVEIV